MTFQQDRCASLNWALALVEKAVEEMLGRSIGSAEELLRDFDGDNVSYIG